MKGAASKTWKTYHTPDFISGRFTTYCNYKYSCIVFLLQYAIIKMPLAEPDLFCIFASEFPNTTSRAKALRAVLRGYCTLTGRVSGEVLSNTVVFMSNKKYTLVAWTEKGQLRMIPSLINECSLPYRERIEWLDGHYPADDNEIGWILARSRAHETLARFFLSVGRPREAYLEYENAALVCAWCSDDLWLQGTRCDFPALPLLYRFLSMHRKCVLLACKSPLIKGMYEGSDLERHYHFFTLDEVMDDREINAELESIRAWEFGKGA